MIISMRTTPDKPTSRGDSPFVPGYPRPLYLAGRERFEQEFEVNLLGKWESGAGAPPLIIHGVRGVGKSALLHRFATISVDHGWIIAARQKADKDIKLRTVITDVVHEFEEALYISDRLSERAKAALKRVRELRVKIALGPVSVDGKMRHAKAEAMSLGQDIARLLIDVGEVVSEQDGGGAVFFLDEIHLLGVDDMRHLMYALEEVMSRDLPLTMVAAGLPQTRGMCRAAGGYAERFNYQTVRPLTEQETVSAFRKTAKMRGRDFTLAAARLGFEYTGGYPEFVQVYGDVAWMMSNKQAITDEDMRRLKVVAETRIRESIFAARMEDARPGAQNVMLAMASLGDGAQRGLEIAAVLGKERSVISQELGELSILGLIYQDHPRGPYQFSIPNFGAYLRELAQSGD